MRLLTGTYVCDNILLAEQMFCTGFDMETYVKDLNI